MMTTMGVERFEDVKSFITAVKEIANTTKDVWILVDDTVAIPRETAMMVTSPLFGNASSKWSVVRSLKETGENGLSITFNIEADIPSIIFLGMRE